MGKKALKVEQISSESNVVEINSNIDISGDINFTGILYENGSPYTFYSPWKVDGNDLSKVDGNDITYETGNVGIGTDVPEFMLDVHGTANVGILTSTFLYGDGSNLQNISVGQLIGTQWVDEGNFDINYNKGGNVGIGETSPDATLHVNGNVFVSSNLEVGTAALFVDTSTSNVGIGRNVPGYTLDVDGDINFTGKFYEQGLQFVASRWEKTGDDISYTTGNVQANNLFVHAASGRVGIGKSIPEYTLDINGDLNFTGNFYEKGLQFVASRWEKLDDNISYETGNVGIGGVSTGNRLHVIGNAYVSSNLEVGTANLFVNTVTGRVGIGKNNPTTALDVVGTITTGSARVTNTTSSTTKGTGALVVLGGLGVASNVTTASVWVDDYIRHTGDTNTYFGFNDEYKFRIETNGTIALQINSDQTHALDIQKYIRHIGDTDTYMGFSDVGDTIVFRTGGTDRLTVTNNSVTATSFTGNLSGTATNATNATISTDNNATADKYITFVDSSMTGNQGLKMDTDLKYKPSTNTLTATLNGTATNATNATISTDNTATADKYITFVDSSMTGNQGLKMDTDLKYKPSTNTLTATLNGSAASLTNSKKIGGVDFNGTTDITPTTFGEATFNTNTLVVKATNDGRVGINKSAPTQALDVNGTILATGLQVTGATSLGELNLTGIMELSGVNFSVANGNLDVSSVIGATGLNISGDINITGEFYKSGVPFVSSKWSTDINGINRVSNVGIGGDASSTDRLKVHGSILATGDITAFSDRRLKSNIKRIENALDKVRALGGYTFTMNDKPSTGLIAQEVLEVLPEAVHGSEETQYSLAYGNIIGLLVEAVKELHALI
jgi:hypothetical protein